MALVGQSAGQPPPAGNDTPPPLFFLLPHAFLLKQTVMHRFFAFPE
jgi:hypothetical protein